jgi:serine/threonine protein kinase
MPRLFCQAGKSIGQDYPIVDNMILGRMKDCAVIVDDDKASREHAKIYKEDGAFHVEDLNSSNGTYLNDIQIDKRRLNYGDKIRIGRTILAFLADPVQNLEGQTVAGFKIEKNLGARGIGIVYRARQVKLARMVALKVLDKDFADDPVFVERFIEDARAAGKLRHTGVIQVFDVGNEGDLYYVCMEYVSGKTLRDTIKEEGAFALQRALETAKTIAEALKEAHDASVIHGELNPANIILTTEGMAKIAELGIPKNPDPAKKDVYALNYLSPEEAMGLGITAQSDIYSFGISMYEMLNGSPPFVARSAEEIIEKHKTEAVPDLSETNRDIPNMVGLMIKKMCLKNLQNRYGSMNAVLEDIKKALSPPRKPSKRLPATPHKHRKHHHGGHHHGHVKHHAKPSHSQGQAVHKVSSKRTPAAPATHRSPIAKPPSHRAPLDAPTPLEIDSEVIAARDVRRHDRAVRLNQTKSIVELVVGVSLLFVLFFLSYIIVYIVLSMASGE